MRQVEIQQVSTSPTVVSRTILLHKMQTIYHLSTDRLVHLLDEATNLVFHFVQKCCAVDRDQALDPQSYLICDCDLKLEDI